MKKLLLVLFLLLIPGVASAQPVVLPNQMLGFDYNINDFKTFVIIRFDMKVDTGAQTSIKIPPIVNDAQTPLGFNTYRVPIPAMAPGIHSITFRACNGTTTCSADSAPFTVNVMIIPTVSGVRIITVPVP